LIVFGAVLLTIGIVFSVYTTMKETTEITKPIKIKEEAISTVQNIFSPERHDLEKISLQINNYFDTEFKLYCFCKNQPRINQKGKYALTTTQKEISRKYKSLLKRKERPNDPHALLINPTIWKSDPVNLDVETLDFSDICALREEGGKPQIISASVVLFCKETEELIFHRRGNVATYPNALHTFGGSYIPYGGWNPDRKGLLSTIFREVFEETQVQVNCEDIKIMAMAKEVSTGFIQLIALGLSVSSKSVNDLQGSWEGEIVQIPFENLQSVLMDNSFNCVPSGKAHVLAWLALGAPNTKKGQKFGNLSAKELFEIIINA